METRNHCNKRGVTRKALRVGKLKNKNMSYEYHCTNCGKTGSGSSGSGPMSGSNPPRGWITKWLSTKVFCSSRCKDEYNSRNSS